MRPVSCGSLNDSHQRSRSTEPAGARDAALAATSKVLGVAKSAGRTWAQAPSARQARRAAETAGRMEAFCEDSRDGAATDLTDRSPLVAARSLIGCRGSTPTSSDMNTQAR